MLSKRRRSAFFITPLPRFFSEFQICKTEKLLVLFLRFTTTPAAAADAASANAQTATFVVSPVLAAFLVLSTFVVVLLSDLDVLEGLFLLLSTFVSSFLLSPLLLSSFLSSSFLPSSVFFSTRALRAFAMALFASST